VFTFFEIGSSFRGGEKLHDHRSFDMFSLIYNVYIRTVHRYEKEVLIHILHGCI
jgi:hypothetical protein